MITITPANHDSKRAKGKLRLAVFEAIRDTHNPHSVELRCSCGATLMIGPDHQGPAKEGALEAAALTDRFEREHQAHKDR